MPIRLMDCGPKCRSRKHAYELNASVSKGSLVEIQRYASFCYNGAQLSDIHGRSALHMAASCGKAHVVEWLMEDMHGDVTKKDQESGWTALHRALFYGQLATARLLIQYKSDLYTRDHEGLGPLDISMKDRVLVNNVPPAVYETTDNHEVFTWGDNSNFTLGHSIEQGRNAPEVVDEFRKKHISIKQVVMCKYHTVFLTTNGCVFTCGHGHGGRLGHPSEETYLVPKQIEGLKTEECIKIAAARDHTLMLCQSGTVYSCGMNTCYQLGQLPTPDKCPVPKPINCKTVKGRNVIGICAGRFHSVLHTSTAVFTCGLNAGQLGHPKPKGDRKIGQLRQVSWLNVKELTIVSVKCSDAATVVLTADGEIYVLHEYQCRKMASNRPDIQRLCVVGGNLDHTDSQILRENGGRELIISYLNTSGKVFIWHEKSPSLKRAHWLIRRQLYAVDFVLSDNGLVIVTDLGEVFQGSLSHKPTPVRETSSAAKESLEGEFGRMSLMELLMKEEIGEFQVRKVPNVHRAMYITADRKGRNFATLQSLPNCSLTDVPVISVAEMTECFSKLLDEADEYDLIHDLVLQVHDQNWPVHRYILVNRCANFPSLLVNKSQTLNEMDVPVIELHDIHPQILEQLLLYIYTDTCDLLTIGAKFVLTQDPVKEEEIFHLDLDELPEDSNLSSGDKKLSAFQVVKQSKGKKKNNEKENHDTSHGTERNPVKLLMEVAKKWGVKGLAKRLGCVSYKKGQICSAGKAMPKTILKFDRNKLRDTKWELYDVSIQSEDDVVFQCHKCILVARLEYFHSMLASGWMETSSSTALSLPVPGDILEILLDYLYTDDSHVVNTTQNVELLCNILVVADQMLVVRLKEMCEAAIAVLVTLKNVGELLEFSTMYNADQLKSTCQQYIVINLSALFEGRYLDMLSDEVIEDLSKYYKNSIPNMARRIITPYDEGPDKAYLEYLASQTTEDSENAQSGATSEAKKNKSKKKRNRTKSSTEEQEKGQERGSRRVSERQISISSDISVKSDEDLGVQELSVDCNIGEKISPSSPVSAWSGSKLQMSQSPKSPLSPQQGQWCQTGHVQHQNLNNSNAACNSRSSQGISGPSQGNSGPGQGNSGPSLRDIMQEEQLRTSAGKSQHNGQKSGKVSWKDVKKQRQQVTSQQQKVTSQQQKVAPQQQKMTPQQISTASVNSVRDKTNINSQPVTQASDKGTGTCPWGSLNKVVTSFRNLMVEDQQAIVRNTETVKVQQTTKPKTPVSKSEQSRHQSEHNNVVSWGLPQSMKTPKSTIAVPTKSTTDSIPPKNPWGVEPASPRSPDGPWMASAIAQSPPDSVFKFLDIVKDEQQKSDVLIKTKNKPLALIQIEEQAIQDLLKFYKADENVDEHITVERVLQESATPVWKRERIQSS